MKTSEAAWLTAAIIVVATIIAGHSHRKTRGRRGTPVEAFCTDHPHNIGVYDRPYTNYPSYEGRDTTWWDQDRRCAAHCAQSPCAVWCR